MQRYASSKLRIGLFVFLLGCAIFATATSFGQSTPAGAGAGAGTPPAADVHERTNPFGLLMRKDTLTDFVFWMILVCSILGVTLIVQGFIKVQPKAMMPEETTNRIREMIGARQFKELIEYTENDPSFVSKSLHPALKRAPSFSAMKEAMETAVAEQTAEHFRKIEYLNIIGNLGPLLGLLGTVFGMIDAFQGLKNSGGKADPAVLSGGISLALTHTMLGLLLAIPCLASFGILRTMVDRITTQGALTAEELLLMIKPAEAKPTASPARSSAAPQPVRKPVAPVPPTV
jgi:biopolymer transport protein ExbB